jgi:hypothetical protein
MKKLTWLLSAAILLIIAACTQPAAEKSKSPADPLVRTTIEKRVNDFTTALLSGSRDSLNDLTSPVLSYGHSNGDIQDKSGFVDSLATKNWTFTQINIADQSINFHGNTAVVRQKLYGEAKNKGKEPAKLALGILMVWKNDDRNWQLYARQAFKLPPPNDVPPAK